MADFTVSQVIAQLRRDMPRNDRVMFLCGEVERLTKELRGSVRGEGPFDKKVYMRDYMRKYRKKKKGDG